MGHELKKKSNFPCRGHCLIREKQPLSFRTQTLKNNIYCNQAAKV